MGTFTVVSLLLINFLGKLTGIEKKTSKVIPPSHSEPAPIIKTSEKPGWRFMPVMSALKRLR
jgi:hypothetical protein